MYVGRYVTTTVHNQKWLKNPVKMAQRGRHPTMARMGTDRLGEAGCEEHPVGARFPGGRLRQPRPQGEGAPCTCGASEDTMCSFSLTLMHG